jgi:hypothetical protein
MQRTILTAIIILGSKIAHAQTTTQSNATMIGSDPESDPLGVRR